MNESLSKRVLNHPDFKKMEREKNTLSWFFSILIFAIYVVYILYIGINPELFGQTVTEDSNITWGIYAGLFVILLSILLTGIYVRKANGDFDDVTERVIKEVEGENHE